MSAQPAAIVGAKILKEAFSDLAISSTVRRSVGTEQLTPEARIQRYLKRLERVLDRKPEKGHRLAAHDRLAERLIRNSCLDLRNVGLIDKVARGIYDSERRTAHEQGHGDNFQQLPYEEVSGDYIRLVHEKHSTQRDTLCRWTDYLQKNDGHYPAWFRYLAVRGVLKMGEYHRDAPSFHKRNPSTIAPFPELNSEALGLVCKVLSDPQNVSQVVTSFDPSNIEPLRTALATKRFANLYAVALRECNKSIDRSRLEGEWRKYDQGSDHTVLEQDLKGKGTGWCTASGSAQAHLKAGDFYVYYTKDSSDQFCVPRVAIRMARKKVAEIRGIAPGQAMEPDLVEVAEERGRMLPGFNRFKKASRDMKRLTEIDKRCFIRDEEFKIVERTKAELTTKDLAFLLREPHRIKSYGYRLDPRIAEIRATIESIPAGMVFDSYADFDGCTSLQSIAEGTVFEDCVNFSGCTSLQSIPESTVFGREAFFRDCSSLQSMPLGTVSTGFSGCTSLRSIPAGTVFYGEADFRNCSSLRAIPGGTVFKAEAYFNGCTSLQSIPEGIVFNRDARFSDCTSLQSIPKGTVFNGAADFGGCTSLQSIPEGTVFKGHADFSGCTSLQSIPEGVVFHGGVAFNGCTFLRAIPARAVFHGSTVFSCCTSLQFIAAGAVFNGDAFLYNCTSLRLIPEGTIFRGDAHFNGCSSLQSIHPSVVFMGKVIMDGCDADLRRKYERLK